jgi:eukaryotic-like serine/threonine-protein kinase
VQPLPTVTDMDSLAANRAGSGPFAVGATIADAYRIDGVLGQGGMGVVYEAADLKLPRRVAIKAPVSADYAHALRQEAQALAAIRHPAFVTVHHSGQHEGVEYFSMERIYGETLAARMDGLRGAGERLTVEETLDILIAIADGLSAAHRAGIAHRDLKTANVILSGERTILLDLGLLVPEVLVGPDNVPAGSLDSIAPEVILGIVAPGRGSLVDLYALGAVAFELLTGVPPYVGESVANVLARHVAGEIPDPRDLRSDVPRLLAVLVRELLAKDPADRPSSAEAVVWQLKELRGHGMLRARRTTVLVVDDDASIGWALRKSLERSFPQLSVRATTDPSAALPREGRSPADAIVLDINMPGINGIEVCMALRSLRHEERPAIIAMSASAGSGDAGVLRDLGVVRFLPKDESLLAAVGDAIGRLRCGYTATSLLPPPPR